MVTNLEITKPATETAIGIPALRNTYLEAAEDDVKRYERSYRKLSLAHKALLSHYPMKFQKLRSGLDRFEARKQLWPELEETNLAVKEAHTLRVPRSQRGGEIIEPLMSKQWFVNMESLAEKALHAVQKGELTVMPERFEKVCKAHRSHQLLVIYVASRS
ncbi:Valine--tRNA ligase, chloroplastic/mitochondrial 2 [Linum perenne]